jgi:predicted 3-demethylubiquinone-9 3-methyltransferase (glyoxalase superfamily)
MRIAPHLWFDNQAQEAAEFYTSVFPDSKVTHVNTIRNTPSGDCDTVSFQLAGQPFMAISAGPMFKFNPAISFIVHVDGRQALEKIWQQFSGGGAVLMPLDKYPFSELYGWLQDKFGISWQLILAEPQGEARPMIMPFLMFTGSVCGKAEEASDFYMSVFKNSRRGTLARYPQGSTPDKEGTVMYTDFVLNGNWFAAIDSAHPHGFSFNEAISLLIPCESQSDIDYYSDQLSAVPQAEQCGWLKDKYRVSWQVWPTAMGEMMTRGTAEQIDRVTKAFMPMKRFDLAALKRAFDGR